jgi:hypothetical protein
MSKRRHGPSNDVASALQAYYAGFTDAALRQEYSHRAKQSASGLDQETLLNRLVKIASESMAGDTPSAAPSSVAVKPEASVKSKDQDRDKDEDARTPMDSAASAAAPLAASAATIAAPSSVAVKSGPSVKSESKDKDKDRDKNGARWTARPRLRLALRRQSLQSEHPRAHALHRRRM